MYKNILRAKKINKRKNCLCWFYLVFMVLLVVLMIVG